MRAIQISYNTITHDLLLEDRPGTKKYIGYFKKVQELYSFFNSTNEGKQLLNRHKLHVTVDLEGITDKDKISELETTLKLMKWNKANIKYINSKFD